MVVILAPPSHFENMDDVESAASDSHRHEPKTKVVRARLSIKGDAKNHSKKVPLSSKKVTRTETVASSKKVHSLPKKVPKVESKLSKTLTATGKKPKVSKGVKTISKNAIKPSRKLTLKPAKPKAAKIKAVKVVGGQV